MNTDNNALVLSVFIGVHLWQKCFAVCLVLEGNSR